MPIAGLHHAGRNNAAGFCVFNDCGVAAEYLRKQYGLQRIAYVDIDAHHGDGMFYGFEDDPDLIFADIHEDGRHLYPGTARPNETGTGRARGTKLNIPMQPGADDSDFEIAWRRVEAYIDHCEAGVHPVPVPAPTALRVIPITHLRYTEQAHAMRSCCACVVWRTSIASGSIIGTGGGGYNRRNLARAWTRVVQSFVEAELEPVTSLLFCTPVSPEKLPDVRYVNDA